MSKHESTIDVVSEMREWSQQLGKYSYDKITGKCDRCDTENLGITAAKLRDWEDRIENARRWEIIRESESLLNWADRCRVCCDALKKIKKTTEEFADAPETMLGQFHRIAQEALSK